MDGIDGKVPCNISVLVGHCTVRASVAGNYAGALSHEQEAEMLSIMERSLQEGAAGISLGLMYEPGLYAGNAELRKVAELCARYNRPLTVHSRAYSAVSMAYPGVFGRPHLLRALDDLVEITRGLDVKLQYSHAIFVGRSSFKYKDEFVDIINRMKADGVDVMFDIYNATLGVSVISVVLPDWYQSMTPDKRKNPLTRIRLAALIKATSKKLGFYFDDIQVAYLGPGNEKYEGMTIHQVAKMEGISDREAYFRLCELSDFKGRINMGPYSTPEIIRDFEHNDDCLYMTDAWVEDFGVQNPSIYDCFPKFLRDSLLGLGDTMPKTIRKMTGASANRFMIPDRGYIRPGYYADLVVFNEDAIKAAQPDQGAAFGIDTVFVNGVKVLHNKQILSGPSAVSGMPIRIGV